MAVSISWNATFRNRVRLLAGIEQEELDNDTIDILANIAAEWFNENTGTTFSLDMGFQNLLQERKTLQYYQILTIVFFFKISCCMLSCYVISYRKSSQY